MSTPARTGWGRLHLLAISLILLFTVAGPTLPAPARAGQAEPAPPIDLAAMALTADDLAAAGMAGYLPMSGAAEDPRELARLLGDWTDQMANDDIEAVFGDVGLQRGYGIDFRQSERDVTRDVYVSVFSFTDAAGAADAFAFHEDVVAESTLVGPVNDHAAIGDGLLMLRIPKEAPDDWAQLSMVLHAGPVIAVVRILDESGEDLATSDAEVLAGTLLGNIEAALAGDAPGLGARVLRLTDDEFDSLYEVRADQYLRRDGADIPFLNDEPGTFDARVEAAGTATDAYELAQFIQEGEADYPEMGSQGSWISRIYRFADEQAAADWLAAQPDLLLESGQEFERLDDMPVVGDDSLTVSYVRASTSGMVGDSRLHRTFMRVGAMTADVYQTSFANEDIPTTAVAAFGALQARCLGPAGCPGAVTISIALTGNLPAAAPQGTPAGEAAIFDPAAIALSPLDLEDAGFEGFGIGFGETQFLDQMVTTVAASQDIPEDEARAMLEDAGFIRWHLTYLYQPEDDDDPAGVAGRTVVSYVVEFGGAEGAEDMWSILEDESDPAAEDVEMLGDIGDEAEATRYEGEDPSTGDPYTQLDVSARVDNLHVGVTVIDWTGGEPDQDGAEALAELLVDRVDDGGVASPGLGNQALRLTGDDVAPYADYYVIRDGEPNARYGESPEAVDAASASYEDATDLYHLWQQLGPDGDAWYMLTMVHFADEDTASAWLGEQDELVEESGAFADYEVDTDAPEVGDESLTYTVASADGSLAYRGVMMRAGTTVALFDVYGPEPPSADAVAIMAEAQAGCVQDGACLEPLPVPDGLFADDPGAPRPERPDIDPHRDAIGPELSGERDRVPAPSRGRSIASP